MGQLLEGLGQSRLTRQNTWAHPNGAALSSVNPLKIVLLDLKLPKVDGIDILRRLKSDERTRGIPVVVVTSSAEDRDIKDAYELGVNSYVTKPIKFDEFAKVVADLGLYWLMLNRLPTR